MLQYEGKSDHSIIQQQMIMIQNNYDHCDEAMLMLKKT